MLEKIKNNKALSAIVVAVAAGAAFFFGGAEVVGDVLAKVFELLAGAPTQ